MATNTSQESTSKWSCITCGVVIPYNPEYNMENSECSNCAAYSNADKLLGGYRLRTKQQILLDMKNNPKKVTARWEELRITQPKIG